MENDKLSPTSLAFIALTNEYCQLVENCGDHGREGMVEALIKLLPRIYITVTDLEPNLEYLDAFISQALDEASYDVVRDNLSALMGEDDAYLEVFLDDMKYSDTPIATSISENLADLYQEFFNLIHSIQDALTETQHEMLCQCKMNAENYWSQTLCNVLRALNAINYGV